MFDTVYSCAFSKPREMCTLRLGAFKPHYLKCSLRKVILILIVVFPDEQSSERQLYTEYITSPFKPIARPLVNDGAYFTGSVSRESSPYFPFLEARYSFNFFGQLKSDSRVQLESCMEYPVHRTRYSFSP